jgi:dephospho-CoA kinase
MDVLCDETWVVYAEAETQLERVMQRGLTREEAQARIDSQMSSDERRERATRIIDTDRPIEKTQAELMNLYQQLLKKLS